jgi:hypothetical protein
MDEERSHSIKGFAETVAPYGADESRAPHTKLSISLPSDLVELVREAAAAAGLTMSATIGASLRRTLADADQVRLDEAIEAQNEENLAWAEVYAPIAAKLWSELEW